MKTKLTLLAVTLAAGIVSTTAVLGRDWVYPQATPKATATQSAKDHCDMGGMAGMDHKGGMSGMCAMGTMSGMKEMSGMCDMAASPAGKGMDCHSGPHQENSAPKAHKSCCN